MTKIIIQNFQSVTIKSEGMSDVHVSMHDMTGAQRGNYINKLRHWKRQGSKGFPPAP